MDEPRLPELRAMSPEAGLVLALRPDAACWDGRFANNAWLQECPKPPDGLWQSNWQKKLNTNIPRYKTTLYCSCAKSPFTFYNKKNDKYVDIIFPFC